MLYAFLHVLSQKRVNLGQKRFIVINKNLS